MRRRTKVAAIYGLLGLATTIAGPPAARRLLSERKTAVPEIAPDGTYARPPRNGKAPTASRGANEPIPSSQIGGGSLNGNVDGFVPDTVEKDGTYMVSGWVCGVGSPASIYADVYAVAPVGQPGSIHVGSFLANNPSEPAVATACGSTGSNYRFTVSVGESGAPAGSPVYVYANGSNVGYGAALANGSGAALPAIARALGDVGPYQAIPNGFLITGWACLSGMPYAIDVDVYEGGPAGQGLFVGRYPANQPSEPAVASACGSTGQTYRYGIPVPTTAGSPVQNIARDAKFFVYATSATSTPAAPSGNFAESALDQQPTPLDPRPLCVSANSTILPNGWTNGGQNGSTNAPYQWYQAIDPRYYGKLSVYGNTAFINDYPLPRIMFNWNAALNLYQKTDDHGTVLVPSGANWILESTRDSSTTTLFTPTSANPGRYNFEVSAIQVIQGNTRFANVFAYDSSDRPIDSQNIDNGGTIVTEQKIAYDASNNPTLFQNFAYGYLSSQTSLTTTLSSSGTPTVVVRSYSLLPGTTTVNSTPDSSITYAVSSGTGNASGNSLVVTETPDGSQPSQTYQNVVFFDTNGLAASDTTPTSASQVSGNTVSGTQLTMLQLRADFANGPQHTTVLNTVNNTAVPGVSECLVTREFDTFPSDPETGGSPPGSDTVYGGGPDGTLALFVKTNIRPPTTKLDASGQYTYQFIGYDSSGNVATVQDDFGWVATTYDSSNRPTQAVTFDSVGNALETVTYQNYLSSVMGWVNGAQTPGGFSGVPNWVITQRADGTTSEGTAIDTSSKTSTVYSRNITIGNGAQNGPLIPLGQVVIDQDGNDIYDIDQVSGQATTTVIADTALGPMAQNVYVAISNGSNAVSVFSETYARPTGVPDISSLAESDGTSVGSFQRDILDRTMASNTSTGGRAVDNFSATYSPYSVPLVSTDIYADSAGEAENLLLYPNSEGSVTGVTDTFSMVPPSGGAAIGNQTTATFTFTPQPAK